VLVNVFGGFACLEFARCKYVLDIAHNPRGILAAVLVSPTVLPHVGALLSACMPAHDLQALNAMAWVVFSACQNGPNGTTDMYVQALLHLLDRAVLQWARALNSFGVATATWEMVTHTDFWYSPQGIRDHIVPHFAHALHSPSVRGSYDTCVAIVAVVAMMSRTSELPASPELYVLLIEAIEDARGGLLVACVVRMHFQQMMWRNYFGTPPHFVSYIWYCAMLRCIWFLLRGRSVRHIWHIRTCVV
jgi:hypothetical protein